MLYIEMVAREIYTEYEWLSYCLVRVNNVFFVISVRGGLVVVYLGGVK